MLRACSFTSTLFVCTHDIVIRHMGNLTVSNSWWLILTLWMFCMIIVGLQVQCGWCGSGCVGWGASQLYNPARNIYIVFLTLRLPGYTWSASSIWSVSLPCLCYYEFLTKQSCPCWCQVIKNYTGVFCGNWRLKSGDDTKLYENLFFYGLSNCCLFPHSPVLDWQNNSSAILLTVPWTFFLVVK